MQPAPVQPAPLQSAPLRAVDAQAAGTQVAVLGPLQVLRDGLPVEVAGARLQALLAVLALEAGRPVPVGRLVEALWAEERSAGTDNALQSLVSRLRRVLGDAGSIRRSAGGYLLDVDPQDVDAVRFERLARRGRAQLRDGSPDAAAASLRTALGLWRGAVEALSGPDAVRLEELRLEALADRVDADLTLGRYGELTPELEALCAAHPLRERFTGQLMTALAGSGRQAEALAAYQGVRARLADELGVDPSPALRERHLAVLRGTVAPPRPAPAPSPGGTPTRPRAPLPRTNLRASVTSFVGREAEIERVRALLDGARLVTVLGPGGAGKTRLAVETARTLADAYDGVWMVELAPVTDPAEVAHTALAALGQRDVVLLEARRPQAPREARDRLVEVLAERRCLLVVDNCEHLLDAVAELVDVVLARCPHVRVVTTSREPLAIAGEALAPLPPLPTPGVGATLEEARALPAVRLFTDRAAAARPGFTVEPSNVDAVVEIVSRLDGLPLAIELAAARLRSLPVGEVALRLSDRFRLLTGGSRTALPRHRTLRAVVDWSWDLLTISERLLAERLAVFPGGVTAEAAAGVCADTGPGDGVGVDADDIPDLLAALTDKSLLQLASDDGPRYRMLETIREYGVERLSERGELAGLRTAHARHFAALATAAEPHLRGSGQITWLRRLDAEHDNILAALRTLCDVPLPQEAVALALDLSWYWTMTGRHAEAATWLGIVLDLPGEVDEASRLAATAVHGMNSMAARELGPPHVGDDGVDPRARIGAIANELIDVDDAAHPAVTVLKPLALLISGDTARGMPMLDAAIAHHDPWVSAMAQGMRARFAENDGDMVGAGADARRALEAFEEAGDRFGAASVLPLLGQLRLYDGDTRAALEAFERTRDLLAEVGSSALDDNLMLGVQIADVRMRLGDAAGARAAAAEAVHAATSRGAAEHVAIILALDGALERQLGDAALARDLQARADAALAASTGGVFGVAHGTAVVQSLGALLDIKDGDHTSARRRLAAGYGAALASKDMPIASLTALATASLAGALGRHEDAARLLGCAARLRGADDPTNPQVEHVADAARAALGQAAYRRAWSAGEGLDRDAALAASDPALLADGRTVGDPDAGGAATSGSGDADSLGGTAPAARQARRR